MPIEGGAGAPGGEDSVRWAGAAGWCGGLVRWASAAGGPDVGWQSAHRLASISTLVQFVTPEVVDRPQVAIAGGLLRSFTL